MAPLLILVSGVSSQAATPRSAILATTATDDATPEVTPFVEESDGPDVGDDGVAGNEYSVTFAARYCPDYTDVFANHARNNIMESLQNLGPDTNYPNGVAVSPHYEDQAPQSNCSPLVGWNFQLGSGFTGKTPATENLSTVTSAARVVTTEDSVPELNASGGVVPGQRVAGAVTITMTAAELSLAQRSSLWVQGGTKAHPLGSPPDFGSTVYGFAALRCANDNVNGDNVEYISLKTSQRHVFCYYYAVKPPPRSGTIIIKKVVKGENTKDVTFDFGGNVSYNPGGVFTLKDNQSIEFIRGASAETGFAWEVREDVPDDWNLAIACTSPGSSTTSELGANGVSIELAARDTVTCTFTNTPDPPKGQLEVQKAAIGADGTFPYTVKGPSGVLGSGEVDVIDGELGSMGSYELTEPGRYVVSETLPVSAKGEWELTGVNCSNADAEITDGDTATITVAALGKGVLCLLTNTFTPNAASLTVRSLTAGGAGGPSTYEIVRAAQDPVDPVRLQVADNTSADTWVNAVPRTPGDATGALDPAKYQIVGFGPITTGAGSWQLTGLTCAGGTVVSSSLATGQIVVTLPPRGATTCDFTWSLKKPSTLDVTKTEIIAGGARTADVVIDVVCTNGFDQTLTVPPSASLPASLTPTAQFLATASCTVSETAQGGNPVTTTWTLTGPAGNSSGTGTTVPVKIDHVAYPSGAYSVAFTNTYRAGTPTPSPSPTPSETTKPQEPVDPPELPEVIDPDVPTVVLPGEVPTTGGRTVKATITCKPLVRVGKVPMGDVRACRVQRSASGKLTLTVSSPVPVRVTLTLSAPATADYAAYYRTKTWVVRPR